MTAPVTLHRCPPYRAFLSVRQCDYNRALAHRSGRAPLGSTQRGQGMKVRECLGCAGVLALDAGTKDLPELRTKRTAPKHHRPSFHATVKQRSLVSFACPPHLVTITELERLTGKTRKQLYARLCKHGIRPAVRASHRLGRPSCYPREEAVRICKA